MKWLVCLLLMSGCAAIREQWAKDSQCISWCAAKKNKNPARVLATHDDANACQCYVMPDAFEDIFPRRHR